MPFTSPLNFLLILAISGPLIAAAPAPDAARLNVRQTSIDGTKPECTAEKFVENCGPLAADYDLPHVHESCDYNCWPAASTNSGARWDPSLCTVSQ